MTLHKKPLSVEGKEYSRLKYQAGIDLEADWLERTAVEKANSIQQLLNRSHLKPKAMMELGCGTGAVIRECQRRNLGVSYTAVDYSHEAIAYLERISEGIRTIAADITAPDFALADRFDVIILSHVLEHLEDPSGFLDSTIRRLEFSHLLIEVPLEDLLMSRIKNRFRDRRINAAGHIQFFTSRTFRELVESHGLRVIDERRYVPILDLDTIRFVGAKGGFSCLRRAMIAGTGHYFPLFLGRLWGQFYYAHHALLCEKT